MLLSWAATPPRSASCPPRGQRPIDWRLGAEGAKLVVTALPPRAAMPLPILAGEIAAAIIGLLVIRRCA